MKVKYFLGQALFTLYGCEKEDCGEIDEDEGKDEVGRYLGEFLSFCLVHNFCRCHPPPNPRCTMLGMKSFMLITVHPLRGEGGEKFYALSSVSNTIMDSIK